MTTTHMDASTRTSVVGRTRWRSSRRRCSAWRRRRSRADRRRKPTHADQHGRSRRRRTSATARTRPANTTGCRTRALFGIGNLDLRGGGAYDSDSALRWRIKGTDLGLETRSLTAEVGVQGKFRVTFGYDELRRNRSDSYQTPYNGAGTNIAHPAGHVAGADGRRQQRHQQRVNVVSARGLVPAIGDAPYIDAQHDFADDRRAARRRPRRRRRSSTPPPPPTCRSSTTSTSRPSAPSTTLGLNYNFDPKWGVDASFRPEHKDGMKPMGTVSRNTGGDISTIIPDVIDTDTNQVDASLNFKGDEELRAGRVLRLVLQEQRPSMSWQNWATGPTGTGTLNTMSSTPSNTFNQVNVHGRRATSRRPRSWSRTDRTRATRRTTRS